MKKVLSIVLSIVMVLCMMPAMAFADTAVDFTDAADIQHDVAVDTLAALAILEGYPDGSFQPAKVVTRAEMAKIIATLLNGGEAPVLSTTTTSYTDTKGHWAAGYIEYCTSLGIVEGVGAGAFAPDAPVTAEQAAKMILVAQGYNASIEGMTGAQWASNTNVLANQNGYYAELKDIDTAAGASREHVAQMLNNALAARTVLQEKSVNKATGEVVISYSATGATMGSKYLGLQSIDTTVDKVEYDKVKGYKYTIGADIAVGDTDVTTIYSTTDYTNLYKMNVTVLYKVVKGEVVVYGMFADEDVVAFEGVYGDIGSVSTDKKSVKIDNVDYKLNVENTIPAKYKAFDGTTGTPAAYEPIKVIDAGNDGDIDVIVYTELIIEKVNFVGKTQFTMNTLTGESAGTPKFADVVTYDGIAKDDYVTKTYNMVTEKYEYAKLPVLENVKVEYTQGTDAVIDGVTYDNAAGKVAAGAEYKTVLAVNGYILDAVAKTTKLAVSDYAVITGFKMVDDYTDTYFAKLFGTDGTEKEVEINKASYDKLGDSLDKGDLVTTSVDTKGKTVLTAADPSDSGFKAAWATVAGNKFVNPTEEGATTIETDAKYQIADGAVVIVEKTVNEVTSYSVITGAALAAKTSVTDINFVAVDEDTATGFDNVMFAYISETETETEYYAYVTDDTKVNYDGKNYTYTLELADKSVDTTKDLLKDKTLPAKGDVVSYKLNEAGKVSEVTIVNMGNKLAVVKYDGTRITFKSGSTEVDREMTKDTVVIYIDSANKTLAEGTIQLAYEETADTPVPNVKATRNGDKIVVLLVDVNNKMA